MKNIILQAVAVIGITVAVNAQNWNPNGDNTTTGKITARNIGIKDGLQIAPGNMLPQWRGHNHLKDRMFVFSPYSSKGVFFSAYGPGADIRFQTGNSWHSKPLASLLLANNGNVGIGTTNPQAKLHVNGNIKVGGYIQGNGRGNATRIKSSFGYIDIGAVNAGRAHFHTDRTHYYFDKSIITQGGGFYANNKMLHLGIQKRAGSGFSYQNNLTLTTDNVGIGTTNPDQKLTVKGKIHAQEVIVDLNVPADYVFEKHYTGTSRLKPSYKMPSLKEVYAYTKKHKHLPGIPSAKQLKKQGMQVGQMTNLLLQKIEELTIYTLEQQQQIKSLKAQVNQLNQTLKKTK